MSETYSSTTPKDSDSHFGQPAVLLFGGSDDNNATSPNQDQSTNVDVQPTIIVGSPFNQSRASSQQNTAVEQAPDNTGKPIFTIQPMDPRSGHPPVDSDAQQNRCVYVRENEARFQIDIQWPPDIEPCWVHVDAPDKFGVSFRHEDENCDYRQVSCGEDNNEFRMKSRVSSASFSVSLSCNEDNINHHVIFRNSDEVFDSITVKSP